MSQEQKTKNNKTNKHTKTKKQTNQKRTKTWDGCDGGINGEWDGGWDSDWYCLRITILHKMLMDNTWLVAQL